MRHVIKQQCFDLAISRRGDAFRIQQLVSDQFHRELTRLIGRVFDQYSNPREICCIDRLEIDLGKISEQDISTGRWQDLIRRKMEEQLQLLTYEGEGGNNFIIHPFTSAEVEQWLFYMRSGYLPWNAPKPEAGWPLEVLKIFATDAAAIRKLIQLITGNETAVERIVCQHNTHFLVALAEVITARPQKQIGLIVKQLARLISCKTMETGAVKPAPGSEWMTGKALWCEVFRFAAGKTTEAHTETIFFQLIKKWFGKEAEAKLQKTRSPLATWLKQWDKKTDETEKRRSLQESSYDQFSAGQPFRPDNQWPPEMAPVAWRQTIDQPNRFVEAGKGSGHSGNLLTRDGEGIYAGNCGLVLLHPFLSAFFKQLRFLEAGKFRNPAIHQKALYLLHLFATGRRQAEEHELVMPKLLCGYPLHLPVKKNIRLSKRSVDEGNRLLLAVIRHWEILKGTSPDGLREAFLQRSGKICVIQDNLLIQVEGQSIDVLLDHLPWSLSLIQLPWRNDLLRVEWR